MGTREDGLRRTTTITVGLVVASVAGAAAIGAAAAARTIPKATPTAPVSPDPEASPDPEPSPGAEVVQQPAPDPMSPPPGDLGPTEGPPIVISVGS